MGKKRVEILFAKVPLCPDSLRLPGSQFKLHHLLWLIWATSFISLWLGLCKVELTACTSSVCCVDEMKWYTQSSKSILKVSVSGTCILLLSRLQGPLFCEVRNILQLQPLEEHLVYSPDHLGGWRVAECLLPRTLLASQYFYFLKNLGCSGQTGEKAWLGIIVLDSDLPFYQFY